MNSSFESIPSVIIDILREISLVRGVSRAWRGVLLDTFNNALFFRQKPTTAVKWDGLIRALFVGDKQTFVELVSRVSTSSPGVLFSSKEAESSSRATAVRRMSYCLFCGQKDIFMAGLPLIQDKLVEVLRGGAAANVLAEVRCFLFRNLTK